MLDDTPADDQTTDQAPQDVPADQSAPRAAAKKAPAKRAGAKKAAKKAPAKRTAAKKAVAQEAGSVPDPELQAAASDTPVADTGTGEGEGLAPAAQKAAKKAATKKATAKKSVAKSSTAKKTSAKKSAAATPDESDGSETTEGAETAEKSSAPGAQTAQRLTAPAAPVPLFQPPEPTKAAPRRRRASAPPAEQVGPGEVVEPVEQADASGDEAAPRRRTRSSRATAAALPSADATTQAAAEERSADDSSDTDETDDQNDDQNGDETGGAGRRRRRRGGRRRRKSGDGADDDQSEDTGAGHTDGGGSRGGNGRSQGRGEQAKDDDAGDNGESSSSRRRRRRRRSGDDGDGGTDNPENTVTRVRKPRNPEDEITALSGSTRLEAKKQRRREGREAGRRRAPIVSEAEFLARREAVDRTMVIRQRDDLTQIAVLEDKVLVEHYVARESQTSLIGNVYLGRVQNVLPSMEAAFIDIGKGRNAVLYAGEVNWDALGAGNGPRKIEQVLKSGQAVLVQVSKDPIGHKGARLTSQISLPGRFLVYVPDGTTSGISRKLPDTERTRLKNLLKEIVPESAGVIVRTAAEGASEDELTRDVERLTARWADIESRVEKGNAPQLLYGEPDLTLKVVRDLFTEDFAKLVVSGDDAWDLVENYVDHVAPDLAERLEKYDGNQDVFAAYRIDEQIAKALDRKVWLPSGGSLVIDRTEAMTVVDVNTGKFTGSGGNLEETVTKNNLEAAEEIIRQLRLRDIGGIIVVDFIDMVLESNRDLVLRRMVECLGRDRTRHQVAEVTSLGLVQMTRKRIGTGLVEAFGESCEHCQGRGLVIHHEPVEHRKQPDDESRRGGRNRGGRGHGGDEGNGRSTSAPSPRDVAAMARAGTRDHAEPATDPTSEPTESTPESPPEPGVRLEADAAISSSGDSGHSATSTTAPDDAAPAAKSTSSRRRRSSKSAGPAAAADSAGVETTTSADSAGVGTTTSADSAGVETTTSADSAGVAERPVVRTRARRGSSRREAGPPAGTESADSGASGTTTSADSAGVGTTTSADSGQPEAPKVVTSTRRRVVRRPAGPPVGGDAPGAQGDAGSGSEAGSGEAPTTPEETAAAPAHVPVKKKGARKR